MRDSSIDIAKGIGIILIVLGHLPYGVSSASDWCTDFVYLFHVPLFFFLSGMFYKEGEKWGTFLKKKIKRLWLPYVAVNIFFTLFCIFQMLVTGENVILVDMIKHCIKICLFLADSSLGRNSWFLWVLFASFILFKVIDTISTFCLREKKKILLLDGVLVLVLWLLISRVEFMGIGRCAPATIFLFSGYLATRLNIASMLKELTPWLLLSGAIVGFSVTSLCCFNKVEMAAGQLGNIWIFFLSSYSGIFAVLCLSFLINNYLNLLVKPLQIVGQQSLSIMLLHLFVFYAINAISQKNIVASFSECDSSIKAYSFLILGVLVPTLLGIWWDRLKNSFPSIACRILSKHRSY